MFLPINEVSVLVTAVLGIAVLHVWYSPLLFGSLWMRSMGKDVHEQDFSQREMLRLTALSIICNGIFFAIIAELIAQSSVVKISASILCVALVGLVTLFMLIGALWERRPLSYVFIHVGYLVVTVFGGMGVIMYWPW